MAFGQEVISADRVSLHLASSLDVSVDSQAFERACDRGDLETAAALYRSDFPAGFALVDSPEFEEWTFFKREALRSRLMQVLTRLTKAAILAAEPRAAVAHATRLVGLDPLSESAHRQLISAHLAAGDRSAAERQLGSCTRILQEELGVPPDAATIALMEEQRQSAEPRVPLTRYVAAVDGVHIAFQTAGSGSVDIVVVPGFVSHIECVWIASALRIGRLIPFDRRGVGLSDRIGARPTVEATGEDILAVLNAVGSRKALLAGASEGGPGCIRFAVDHPDRLVGLVLWGSLAKGSREPDYPYALSNEQYDLWYKRLVKQWGGPAEISTFAPSLVGDRQAESWWAGLLRAASSPGAVRGVLEALRDTDVRYLLPKTR